MFPLPKILKVASLVSLAAMLSAGAGVPPCGIAFADDAVTAKPGTSISTGWKAIDSGGREISYSNVYRYMGKPSSPIASITDGTHTATEGDYIVKYFHNRTAISATDANGKAVPSTALAIVLGVKSKGYTGAFLVPYKIAKTNLGDTAQLPDSSFSYPRPDTRTGKPIGTEKAKAVLPNGSLELVQDTDFSFSYEYDPDIAEGTGYAVFSALAGDQSRCVNIRKIPFEYVTAASFDVQAIPDQQGYDAVPAPQVSLYGKTLQAGTDYKCTYIMDKSSAKGTVTISGLGKYSGVESSVTFNVVTTSNTDNASTGKTATNADAAANAANTAKNTASNTSKNTNAANNTSTATNTANNTSTAANTANNTAANTSKNTNTATNTAKNTSATSNTAKNTTTTSNTANNTATTNANSSKNSNTTTATGSNTAATNTQAKSSSDSTAGTVSLSAASISEIPEQECTALDVEVTPEPTVTLDGKTLVLGTDYTLSYKKNTVPGTATVIVEGQGRYSGQASATFEIAKIKLSDAAIAKISQKAYSGKKTAITPTPKVTLGDTVLELNRDYTLSYKNNSDCGTATIIATGKGYYTGKAKSTFVIAPRNMSHVSISKIKTQYYSGKKITPKVSVSDNGKTLKEGQDYSVSYSDNKKTGTAHVSVKGKGDYTGTKTAKFTIEYVGAELARTACRLSYSKPRYWEANNYDDAKYTGTKVYHKAFKKYIHDWTKGGAQCDRAIVLAIIVSGYDTHNFNSKKHR